LTKYPFLSHTLPLKILSDCIRFSLLWISQIIICLQGKVVILTSNPHPGEPVPRAYIPPWQGGPVTHPGIAFPFRHHLRLVGLREGILTRLHTGTFSSLVNHYFLTTASSVVEYGLSVCFEISIDKIYITLNSGKNHRFR
jgi:hypothetical protein